MNTDDRQQQREQAPANAGAERSRHIDTLARAMNPAAWNLDHRFPSTVAGDAARTDSLHAAEDLFDSTDPAVHDALVAALHANADRARVLAAHADAGWLERGTSGRLIEVTP